MGKIMAIEPQKRNPQRVNIYLDGEFAFALSRLVAAWLRVGEELSAEKIASLQAADTREQAPPVRPAPDQLSRTERT
jgi:regulatory protein